MHSVSLWSTLALRAALYGGGVRLHSISQGGEYSTWLCRSVAHASVDESSGLSLAWPVRRSVPARRRRLCQISWRLFQMHVSVGCRLALRFIRSLLFSSRLRRPWQHSVSKRISRSTPPSPAAQVWLHCLPNIQASANRLHVEAPTSQMVLHRDTKCTRRAHRVAPALRIAPLKVPGPRGGFVRPALALPFAA